MADFVPTSHNTASFITRGSVNLNAGNLLWVTVAQGENPVVVIVEYGTARDNTKGFIIANRGDVPFASYIRDAFNLTIDEASEFTNWLVRGPLSHKEYDGWC